MKWAAIDFETATRSRTSACALGVVTVDDGEITARQAWLIRPPANEYEWGNIRVHGIRPGDTELAPGYAEVWAEAMQMVGSRPIVAHNAAFDIGVARASAVEFGAPLPPVDYACTVSLARKALPGLTDYKLPTVAHAVGALDELTHHDALSDAVACSSILRACFSAADDAHASLHELAHSLKVQVRPMDQAALDAEAAATPRVTTARW